MKTYQPMSEPASSAPLGSRSALAFTLVEMIVVTGIIALLAALIFPVTGAVKKSRDLSRARTELMMLAHAIDGYKDKLGHFPPDNTSADPLRCAHSQLFYELRGTVGVVDGQGVVVAFQRPDGPTNNLITVSEVQTAFGTGGFINCTRPGAGDEAQPAQKFLPDVKAGHYLDWQVNGINCRLLGCTFDGPNAVTDPDTGRKFSFWWYNYTSPTNGIAPYDLCVDILVGGKIYRVSNWSTKPQML